MLASFLRLSASHLRPHVIRATTQVVQPCGVMLAVGRGAHLLLELLPLARRRDEVDDVHEDGVEDRLAVVVVEWDAGGGGLGLR